LFKRLLLIRKGLFAKIIENKKQAMMSLIDE